MSRFQFRSGVGDAIAAGQATLEQILRRKVEQEEAERRQRIDAITNRRADQELELRRQELERRAAAENRDYADTQARQKLLDERYQQERQDEQMQRKDAAANRYLDVERGYFEADKRRQADASEAAAQRKHAREIVDRQMRGGDKAADGHDAARVTIDALDELSTRINDAEGLAAKATGTWRKAAASANYDDDVAEYNAVLEGAIPSIARKMGHTGVLTEQDVASVRGMFPKPGDSKSLRDRKINRIRSIMNMPGGNASRVRRFNPATGKIE